MQGHDEITAARLQGIRVSRVAIDVLRDQPHRAYPWQRPGIERDGDEIVGRIEVYADDVPDALDLRCCYGLPVSIIAPSYTEGWPVAVRVTDAEPARLTFASPELAARFSTEWGLQAWEL